MSAISSGGFMNTQGGGDGSKCGWCSSQSTGLVCPVCNGPHRWMVPVFVGYKLLAIAVAPLAIALATVWFSSEQEKTARAAATHEKLLASYVDFAQTHSNYRHAAGAITFLASSSAETVPAQQLKTAVLDLDNAFDSVGAKLTPFEDVEKRIAPDRSSLLSDLWQSCFIHSYFDKAEGYWPKVEAQLSHCNNDTCPIDVARALNAMLASIDQPKCAASQPDLQKYAAGPVNMATIWNELSVIITTQCVDEKLECNSPFQSAVVNDAQAKPGVPAPEQNRSSGTARPPSVQGKSG